MKKWTLAALAPYQKTNVALNNNAKTFFLLVLLTFLLIPLQSFAAIDVAAAITAFADVNTAIPLVGAAFLAALGLMACWKLVRGAFA